jgi:elongation factor G
MMMYLEGEELSADQIAQALRKAFLEGALFPIFITSGEKAIGTTDVLDAIAAFFPNPAARPRDAKDETSGEPIELTADMPFSARVFRINFDPFVGKISYLKICSGEVKAGAIVRTKDAKNPFKLAHLYTVQGKETKDVKSACAGDIIAVSKVEELDLGDTVTLEGHAIVIDPPVYPNPMVALAVEPKSRADEAKISGALGKLVSADPTLQMERNPDTHELVVHGMSNLHLDTLFARLKSRYKIEVVTGLPKISYLETIAGGAEADYRHKKQSGGSGQFAHVYLRLEPTERGSGFEFSSKVVGGAISSSYLPSIEKGIKQVMGEGVIAGFKFIDCKVEVYDGKEHPVDSKDIAFQIAGRNAFKEAVQKAKPVLLEPICNVEITCHQEHMGAIMGDLNTRRGRIHNTKNEGQLAVVEAQVPAAEMQTYSNELRSLTGGEGSFGMTESHYDVVPQHLMSGIIAKYKKADEE